MGTVSSARLYPRCTVLGLRGRSLALLRVPVGAVRRAHYRHIQGVNWACLAWRVNVLRPRWERRLYTLHSLEWEPLREWYDQHLQKTLRHLRHLLGVESTPTPTRHLRRM